MDCRFWYSIPESNERYIVIEVHRWRTGTAAGSLATVSRSGRLLRLAPVIPGRRILTAAGLATAKHLHSATNVYHHLCDVFLLAGLIGPFACAQLALDVNLGAFAHIFTRNFCQLAENNHSVPLDRKSVV